LTLNIILIDASNNVKDFQVAMFPDPVGFVAVTRMTEWIKQCNNNHQRCQNGDTRFSPTRLLDVGAKDLDTVTLVEPVDKVEYLALSHCWGQSNAFITTPATMDQMKKGFLLTSNIPKTFRDAIIVTRKLGIRYLWIDSLCIIQGDVADWEREASRMADVYRGAYLTIGAINASDDREGFLTQRKPPAWELKVFTSVGKSTHVYLRAQGDEFTTPSAAPLDTRGWTLQEQYLSRRMLRFSDYQTTWRCQEMRHEELQLAANYSLRDWTITELSEAPRADEKIHHKWYYMVRNYSSRKLSVDTDRLPALSGLASYVARFRNGQYCAGMWWGDIGHVLCWRVARGARASRDYIAPSWSWVSLFGTVSFPHQLSGDYLSPKPMSSVTYLDFHLEPKGIDVFGQLARGWLLLQAVMVRLIRPFETQTGEPRYRIHGIEERYQVGVKFDLEQSQQEVLGLVLMREGIEEIARRKRLDKVKLIGILIQEARQEDSSHFRKGRRLPRCESVFQRVGYFDVEMTTKEEEQILKSKVRDIVLI
jgi:hypothetical protein